MLCCAVYSIINNDFCNSTFFGVYDETSTNTYTVQGNYWGTDDTAQASYELYSSAYQPYGVSSLSSPILTAPVTTGPRVARSDRDRRNG